MQTSTGGRHRPAPLPPADENLRRDAIDAAHRIYDSGEFLSRLSALVGFRTESQDPAGAQALREYLTSAISPLLNEMGFVNTIVENEVSPDHPALIARLVSDHAAPTLLLYGHADVQLAHAEQWRSGLDPWQVTADGGRWYGRGVADNKGQHLINLVALQEVLKARGHLGFNVTLLLETGEETGSPGLEETCRRHRDLLEADLFIGSDGPRLSEQRPTVFLGSRGVANFSLTLALRDGSHHSGNWGGLLRNPATVVANAIASLIDSKGRLRVEPLRSAAPPESVRRAVAGIEPGAGGPPIDTEWGEPAHTPAERVFASNTMEVLAIGAGDPDGAVNSIPGRAAAHCQLRFVPGLDPEQIQPALRKHLDQNGFGDVEVSVSAYMSATRLDPDSPWVGFAMDSLQRTTGKSPALLPGIGGSLPNAPFAQVLGLPTLWIPHSYPGCAQHAPNEHLPEALVRESLGLMAGLFSDLAALDQWPPEPGDIDGR